jgi:hypothetical protein
VPDLTGTDDWQCRYVCMYVVLSRLKKHLTYGDLVGTTECVTLLKECCTNGGRYNRFQLHFVTRN